MSGPAFANSDLPASLLALIDAGRWKPPKRTLLEAYFEDMAPEAKFFDTQGMQAATSWWKTEADLTYFGQPEGRPAPTNLVIIGDLGPDQLLVLDYGANPPRVCYFGTDGAWHLIADSIDLLIVQLGLLDEDTPSP